MNTLRQIRRAANEPMVLFALLLTLASVCHHNNASKASENIIAIAENFSEGVRKNEDRPARHHRAKHR